MVGKYLIYTIGFLFIFSSFFYFASIYRKQEKIIRLARTLLYGGGFAVVFVSAVFLGEILAHNFQYSYIYNFSSKDLPLFLLISTFWAGQEGSFLLWLLCLSLITFLLLPVLRQRDLETYSMGFLTLILFFLALMLILKNPFDYLWETYKDMGVPKGTIPPDGRGLNPILKNFWIVIHPPVLFLGYAGMAFPYVLALAGLLKNDIKNWIELALPLTILASFLLGAGIMLGGIWAYETLGWGGFWGWDPVENSSLIPWLLSIALIHTLNIQKRTGKLIRTNFLLAILSFILVLYSTFLTRSGILSEISVHSFVEPGTAVYTVLLVFMLLLLLIGIIVWGIKYKSFTPQKLHLPYSSKEFWIITGSILLLVSGWIIFLGTSYPIIANILNQPQTTVDTKFYDNWNFPIAVLIMLIIGTSYYLSWGGGTIKNFLNRIFWQIILSLLLTIFSIIFLNISLLDSFFIFAGIFCFIISILELISLVKRNFWLIGTALSHIGIIFILVGALISGSYAKKEVLSLEEGVTKSSIGYQFTYTSKIKISGNSQKEEKYIYNILAKDNSKEKYLEATVLWSDFNEFKAPFFEPAISSNLLYDLYISPKAIEPEIKHHIDSLKIGEPKKILLEDTLNLTLKDLSLIEHTFSQQMSNSKIYKGIVELKYKNKIKNDTLYLLFNKKSQYQETYWINLEDSKYKIGLTNIYFENEQTLQAKVSFSKEIFIVEVDWKPLIKMVWIGTIISLLGLLFSIIKHIKYRQNSQSLLNI